MGGLGGRSRGRRARGHRHNHGARHHHHHAQRRFGGMVFLRGGGAAHPLRHRLWSGLMCIGIGFGLGCYGCATFALDYGYFSTQGLILMVVGFLMVISGILVVVKINSIIKSQAQNRGQAVTVSTEQGGTGSQVNISAAQPGVWTTGQHNFMSAPPPYGAGPGQPQPGYPTGRQPDVGAYPQPYPQAAGGQMPYFQQQPPGTVSDMPPPTQGQGWVAGTGPQFYQVQPAYPNSESEAYVYYN